jgi:hypothetical protein
MRFTITATVAIMLLGIMSVAAFTLHPRQPEAAPRAAATPEPALNTFYVPAQYVNMGRFEEPVQELY